MTYKSVDKEKIKFIMICAHVQCKQKQRYSGIEHAGHKAKSGQSARPFSTSGSGTLFVLFRYFCLFKKHVKTLQE